MKRKALLATAGLLTLGLVASFAQRPNRGAAADGPRPGVEALTTYLELSDSQITGFQAIRDNAQTAIEPIAEQARTKAMELRQALREDGPDAAAVGALQVEIEQLRDQIQQIRADAAVQAKSSLNANQQSKLTELESAAALQQEVRAAVASGLIAPPEGEGRGGPGFGPGGRGKGGPGGRGKGFAGRFAPAAN